MTKEQSEFLERVNAREPEAVAEAVDLVLTNALANIARLEAAQVKIATLKAENARLKVALWDAVNRPKGVVPDSAAEWLDMFNADRP